MIELPAASRRALRQAKDIRRRFLTTVMSAALLWGGLISIPSAFGWLPLGGIQSANNLAFLVANVVLLAVLIVYPRSFKGVATIFFVAAFAYITAAQFFVPNDQLRMLLYFPLVGAVFLILGSPAGWITMVAALCVFAAAFATEVFPVSPLAASTFALTLGMTAVFFQVFQDRTITALNTIIEQNSALDAAAKQDPLTGLLNRRAFQDNLQSFLAVQGAAVPFSIAFVDVDRFKEINDRFGHAAGDAVLMAIAEVLRAVVRRNHDIVARVGGEEFAIMLPHTDMQHALAMSERLRTAVGAADIEFVPELEGVTVSIGVASSTSGLRSADDIIRAADAAMYTAKREGRDRVVAWVD